VNGWSGIAIITSEYSLLDSEIMSGGANVRCLTMTDIKWTQDAAHSDRLKVGALANYGYLGQRVADYVANLSIDDVLELHSYYATRIKGKMKTIDGFSDRIASKLAPILMAAQYFNEMLNRKLLDIDLIEKQLIDINEACSITRDPATETYYKLLEYIVVNRNHFICSTKNPDEHIPVSEVYGKIVNRDGKKYVLLVNSIFDKFCNIHNITEKLTFKKKWLKEGKIVTNEPNRYDEKINHKDFKARCMKIVFDEFPVGTFGICDEEELKAFKEEQLESQKSKTVRTPVYNEKCDDEAAIDELFKEDDKGQN